MLPAANKDLAGAFKFVSIFAVLFVVAYFALEPVSGLNQFAAISSQFVLSSLFGASSALNASALPFPIIDTLNVSAEISDLCSMKIEMAILFAIVFASHDRKLRYRAKGFIAGLLLIFLFNPLRIATTIYLYDSSNAGASALFHDVLFRASIILFIVTFYSIWYYWDKK